MATGNSDNVFTGNVEEVMLPSATNVMMVPHDVDGNNKCSSPSSSSSSTLKTIPAWLQSRESLPFSCTECGKCCQRADGDVYMSPHEVVKAAEAVKENVDDFIRSYSSHVLFKNKNDTVPWIRLQNKQHEIASNNDNDKNASASSLTACVFLDVNTKHCRIYEARPLQCQAYPFYDSLLVTADAWNAECRRRDDDSKSDLPAWTPETMGCEGMRPIGSPQENEGESVPMERAIQYLHDFRKLEAEMYKKSREQSEQDGGLS